MIRQRIVASLFDMAKSLGHLAEGSEWHLFGSVERDDPKAADIDLMILCKSDSQCDELRRVIDPEGLTLPLHLSFMTFDEANDVDAVRMQLCRPFFPHAADTEV